MAHMDNKDYDYIIAGGGLSGLSLLYYILNESTLSDKTILVIDSEAKTKNDRTWCFWEKEKAFYEDLVTAKWKKLKFESPTLDRIFELEEYEYKLIRSIDYYQFIREQAVGRNVEFKTETIKSITDIDGLANVETENNQYRSTYVFNSTNLFAPEMSKENTLLQHFEGWFIRTEDDQFDESVGTLMDFTLPQDHGVTFMYILPTSANEALVEYTLFSEELLNKEEYGRQIKQYISEKLNIPNYEIVHTEFGVIPMSTVKFSTTAKKDSNIINIGTTGGYTKASTGYTFRSVHKNVTKIVGMLVENKRPVWKDSFREKMFRWYDMTLLDILLKKKLSGEKIFTSLFKKNNPEKVLAFLADESTHKEEFKIRNSVPLGPFMTSGMKQLFKR
jgi:lycopene beta-cyclase